MCAIILKNRSYSDFFIARKKRVMTDRTIEDKEKYMSMALELAEKGLGTTSPNPMVGAVIVKNGEIIGKGFHKKAGSAHAEVEAVQDAHSKDYDIEGADMYVTLEPCSHKGRTPACSDLLIKEKIGRVFIGMRDPNPLVNGGGIEKLEGALIKCEVGILEERCRQLNKVFLKYVTEKMPYVIFKSGITLDGKIATGTGKSKWITSEESRKDAHLLRSRCSAIMVGIGTVLADDPRLTARFEGAYDPVKIIVDSKLRLPLEAKVVGEDCIVGCCENVSREKIEELTNKGVKIIKAGKNKVELRKFMAELAKLEIDSVLLEGGATLAASMFKEQLVDEIRLYMAPMIFGSGKSFLEGELDIDDVSDAIRIEGMKVEKINEDVVLSGNVKRNNA